MELKDLDLEELKMRIRDKELYEIADLVRNLSIDDLKEELKRREEQKE